MSVTHIETVKVGSSILPAPTRTKTVRDARTGGPQRASLNHLWSLDAQLQLLPLDDQLTTTGAKARLASLCQSATEPAIASRRLSKGCVYRSSVKVA